MSPDSVLAAFNARGYTHLKSLAERLGCDSNELWPHVQALLRRGIIRRVSRGCFIRRARPSLPSRPSPTELRILRQFVIEEPRGYWQITLDAGFMGTHDARNRKLTPGTPGVYLTRLVRRGLLFRYKRGMYMLSQAGLEYLNGADVAR